jgi:PAS domain-containing protein
MERAQMSQNYTSCDGRLAKRDHIQYVTPPRKLEELSVVIIDESGTVCECNDTAGQLLGGSPKEIVELNISTFLPQFKEHILIKENRINPHLQFLSRIGHPFVVIDMHKESFKSELFFSEKSSHKTFLRLILCPLQTG